MSFGRSFAGHSKYYYPYYNKTEKSNHSFASLSCNVQIQPRLFLPVSLYQNQYNQAQVQILLPFLVMLWIDLSLYSENNFYIINCACTGAYAANNYNKNLNFVSIPFSLTM